MDQLQVSAGDEIVVEGRSGSAHGRRVILAERLRAHNRWHTVNAQDGHRRD